MLRGATWIDRWLLTNDPLTRYGRASYQALTLPLSTVDILSLDNGWTIPPCLLTTSLGEAVFNVVLRNPFQQKRNIGSHPTPTL